MTANELGLIYIVIFLQLGLVWIYRRFAHQTIREVLRIQEAYERRADRLERTMQSNFDRSEEKTNEIREVIRVALLTQNREATPGQEKTTVISEPYSVSILPDRFDQRRLDRLQNDISFIKNRLSSYLGDGTGLTYLVDETPIYINSNDFGCPSNFLNGGRYEEENQQVLASFRRPNSVFLDIGANLGVFSLRLAPMMRQGHVYAFEPNKKIHELFSRSVHLNGLRHLIDIFELGASDREQEMVLSIPSGHAGGASVTEALAGSAPESGRIRVSTLDKTLQGLPEFHLAKIDVEGHELNALRGMAGLVARSSDAVILFEKLGQNTGIESELKDFFDHLGMVIYRIDGVTLVPVNLPRFCIDQAYFLAAHPERIVGEVVRNFIDLYPADFFGLHTLVRDELLVGNARVHSLCVIFHGPYWYLPRGTWRLSVNGRVDVPLKIVIAEKFGYQVADFILSAQRMTCDFIIENDLSHFEIVGRAVEESVSFAIRSIRLTRLG